MCPDSLHGIYKSYEVNLVQVIAFLLKLGRFDEFWPFSRPLILSIFTGLLLSYAA